MKKLIFLILFTVLTGTAQNSSWKEYKIGNSIEISVPATLELRGNTSVFNQEMDNLRAEYNPDQPVKIGKSKLIFQPKGTDNLEKSATDDVTRILVAHMRIDSSTFPKWNFTMSNQELSATNEFLKKDAIKEIKTLPFESEITTWYPLKKGSINGLSYLKMSYLSIVEGDKSYTETYQFFNKNEKVIITCTTPLSNRYKWKDVFYKIIETFDFRIRK